MNLPPEESRLQRLYLLNDTQFIEMLDNQSAKITKRNPPTPVDIEFFANKIVVQESSGTKAVNMLHAELFPLAIPSVPDIDLSPEPGLALVPAAISAVNQDKVVKCNVCWGPHLRNVCAVDDWISSQLCETKMVDGWQESIFQIRWEGSQIDWGGHANDIDYITSEFIEFNKTIEVALNYAKNNSNTLVIVTADHETGGLAITMGKTKNFEMVTSFNTVGHSATMVPVFSYGKFSELFTGIYENNQIFHKMIEALNMN